MRRLALPILCVLLAGACRSTGAVPRPFPSPGVSRVPGASPAPREPPSGPTPEPGSDSAYGPAASQPLEVGSTVSDLAVSLVGVHYRNGGDDPAGGFDCSGFVWYLFARHGLTVPRTVGEQYRAGRQVETRDARAGDLVFFNTTGVSPSHVGILLEGNEFVHAPSMAGQVRIERLTARYWAGRFVGIRRLE